MTAFHLISQGMFALDIRTHLACRERAISFGVPQRYSRSRLSIRVRSISSDSTSFFINPACGFDVFSFLFFQEPLDVLPTLLPCRHDGAMDLIRICALNNSPKELMIVVQEAIEYTQSRLNNEEEEEEEENDPNLVQRTIGIVSLCSPGSFLVHWERFDRLIDMASHLPLESWEEICTRIMFSCLGKRRLADLFRLPVWHQGRRPRGHYRSSPSSQVSDCLGIRSC